MPALAPAPRLPVRLQIGDGEPVEVGEVEVPMTIQLDPADAHGRAALLATDPHALRRAVADVLDHAAATLRKGDAPDAPRAP